MILLIIGINLTISINAAPTLAQDVSYARGSYVLKNWNGHKYYEISIAYNNKDEDCTYNGFAPVT